MPRFNRVSDNPIVTIGEPRELNPPGEMRQREEYKRLIFRHQPAEARRMKIFRTDRPYDEPPLVDEVTTLHEDRAGTEDGDEDIEVISMADVQ
ncbi:hypothetical protein TrVFT333_010771 [Trichoderma virens FT-333]|nr:hypothetical protein TrVFT333_010771 [Trichoderma virens FT-333]